MGGINWENLPKCPPNLVSYYETIWGVCRIAGDCAYNGARSKSGMRNYHGFIIHYHNPLSSYIVYNESYYAPTSDITDILYAIDKEV